MVDQTTILIVDDEPRVLDALEAVLAAEFRVLRAESGAAALDLLRAEDVAVIAHRLPDARDDRRRDAPRVPGRSRRTRSGIVLTAYTDVDSLMDAVNTGHIYHFVAKPWDSNELLVVVRRAAERYALAQENARLRDELELAYNAVRRQVAEIARATRPPSIAVIGAATGLREAVGLARKVLDTDTTVLLRGETGTGKELFARLIHDNGRRRERQVRRPELRRPVRDAAGVRALRPRARRVHRRHRASAAASSRRPTAARSSSTRSGR